MIVECLSDIRVFLPPAKFINVTQTLLSSLLLLPSSVDVFVPAGGDGCMMLRLS